MAAWREAASPDERLAGLPVAYIAYSSLGATRINQALRKILGKKLPCLSARQQRTQQAASTFS